MSDNQIIEAEAIVIEPPKEKTTIAKPLLAGAIAGLVAGLLGSFSLTQLMPKDDILGKMQLIQSDAEAQFNKKLMALQGKLDDANKANVQKIASLETALKNIPETKEVSRFENSDTIKAQVEGLKAEVTKLAPKLSLFEKEQGTNKSSQALALGYIALNNLERGDAIPQEIKRLALINPNFNGLNSLTEKPLVTAETLVKTLKSVILKEVKQEVASGWLDKMKLSASALVKITSKDAAKTPQLGELEAMLLSKNFTKSTLLWNSLKTTVENDKGFEAQLQLANMQSEEIAHIRTILAKMSAEQ